LSTASKPLIYLRFLKSYNYTPTMASVLTAFERLLRTLAFFHTASWPGA